MGNLKQCLFCTFFPMILKNLTFALNKKSAREKISKELTNMMQKQLEINAQFFLNNVQAKKLRNNERKFDVSATVQISDEDLKSIMKKFGKKDIIENDIK